MKVDIPVGEHYPLRLGAGPTRIEKFGEFVFVDVHDVEAVRCGSGEKRFVILLSQPFFLSLGIESVERTDRRKFGSKGFNQLVELFLQKERGGAGIVQNEGKFRSGQTDVERQQNGAGVDHAEIGFEQAVAVSAQKGHAITVPGAGLAESAG